MRLAFSIRFTVIWFLVWHTAAALAVEPVVARKPSRLVTYRFTARITDNAGVTPFKVGTKITGEFRYDLTAKNTKNLGPKFALRGEYESPKNRIVFSYGKHRFLAKGRVEVNTGTIPQIAEDFAIITHDLLMPKGWEFVPPPGGKKDRSRAFGIVLQNYPPRGVLPTADLPKALTLSKFLQVRNLAFDFYYGVRFPGGSVMRRAKVEAEIQEIERVSKNETAKP
jgi:hypothetical protein